MYILKLDGALLGEKRDFLVHDADLIIVRQNDNKLITKIKVNKRPMGHIAHLRNQFKLINILAKL